MAQELQQQGQQRTVDPGERQREVPLALQREHLWRKELLRGPCDQRILCHSKRARDWSCHALSVELIQGGPDAWHRRPRLSAFCSRHHERQCRCRSRGARWLRRSGDRLEAHIRLQRRRSDCVTGAPRCERDFERRRSGVEREAAATHKRPRGQHRRLAQSTRLCGAIYRRRCRHKAVAVAGRLVRLQGTGIRNYSCRQPRRAARRDGGSSSRGGGGGEGRGRHGAPAAGRLAAPEPPVALQAQDRAFVAAVPALRAVELARRAVGSARA